MLDLYPYFPAGPIRRILAAALLMGATATGLAAQAPAPVPVAAPAAQKSAKRLSDGFNTDLPRWLSFSGEYRMRVEGIGNNAFKTNNADAFVLSRIRINSTIKPASWMRLQIQLQDSQVMARNIKPDAPPFQDQLDLRLGYIEIGSAESSTAAVRFGRQELAFGEQRLVGPLNWTNTARTFDAVKLTVRNKKARLDMFSSSVVRQFAGPFDKSGYGDYFHGAYSVFSVLPNKGTIEPYFYLHQKNDVKSEGGPVSRLTHETVGFRAAGKLPASFDYSIESVGQFGTVAADQVRAFGGHAQFSYTAAKLRFKPRFIGEFNYASGDNNATDGRRETFDQLYPTGHDKNGLTDQVGWKNIEVTRAGIELKPWAKVAVTANYLSLWLADAHDSLYNAGGASIAKVAAGTAGRHVGQEADIQAVITVSPLLQVSGGYGHLFSGQFLRNATPGQSYRFSYIMAAYQF